MPTKKTTGPIQKPETKKANPAKLSKDELDLFELGGKITLPDSELVEEEDREHENGLYDEDDSDGLKAMKWGINQLFNDDNLSKKTDLTTGLIVALARAQEFGQVFNCAPMLRLVDNIKKLRISKDRQGRAELTKALSSMGSSFGMGGAPEMEIDPADSLSKKLLGTK